MVIQHNLNALDARNKLKANITGSKKSSEKLSSGYRINRAGDDAAGLAVSEKMRSQIRGLSQAVRNAQDGINMIQTFEGAAQESHSVLQRMKELAVESANGTYDNATDRAAIQSEFCQLNDELDHIAETDFNGITILDTPEAVFSALNSTDDVGLPNLTRDIGEVGSKLKSGFDIQIKQIYNDTNATDLTASILIHITEAQIRNDPKIMTLMRQCHDRVNDDKYGLLLGYEEIGVGIPLDIVLSESKIAWFGTGAASNGDDKNEGPQIGEWLINLDDGDNWDVTTSKIIPFSIQRINWVSDTPDEDGSIEFRTDSDTTIKVFDIIIHSSEDNIQGTLGFDLTMNVFDDEFEDDIEGDDTDKAGDFKVSIPNAFGNAAAKLTYTDHLILQVGARSKDSVNFTFKYNADIGNLKANLNLTSSEAGLGTAKLSLADQESANYAIDRIDNAINKVSMVRASFGSAQNRLEHKITNLTTSAENLTEAESAIRDTDMASEMMNYTKLNILQQAAQSMLAQANRMPQSVLQLLE